MYFHLYFFFSGLELQTGQTDVLRNPGWSIHGKINLEKDVSWINGLVKHIKEKNFDYEPTYFMSFTYSSSGNIIN